jgi:hypothetical protein
MLSSREFASRVLQESAKNASVQAFTSHPELITIIRKAEDVQRCIDGYGKVCMTFAQVTANLTGLEKVIDPVYARIQQNASIATASALLTDTIELVKGALEVDWPARKIGGRTLERISEIVKTIEEWLSSVREKDKGRVLWKFADVGSDAYDAKSMSLFKAYQVVEAMPGGADEGDDWEDPFVEPEVEAVTDVRRRRSQESLQAVANRAAMMKLKGIIARKKKEAQRSDVKSRGKKDEAIVDDGKGEEKDLEDLLKRSDGPGVDVKIEEDKQEEPLTSDGSGDVKLEYEEFLETNEDRPHVDDDALLLANKIRFQSCFMDVNSTCCPGLFFHFSNKVWSCTFPAWKILDLSRPCQLTPWIWTVENNGFVASTTEVECGCAARGAAADDQNVNALLAVPRHWL